MGESEELLESQGRWMVQRGETYVHADHGPVEVTGIWKGVTGVDEARRTEETGTILVRFAVNIDGERVNELADTLNNFLEATE